MADAFFDGTNAGLVSGGYWSADFSNAGIRIRQAVGFNSDLRFVATGTEAKLRVFGTGFTFKWKVDGGSEQTASPGGNANAEITLFTGLIDTAHTVVVYACQYVAYSGTNGETLKVTGVSPSLAAPSGYTNTQYVIRGQSGISEDNGAESGTTENYPTPRARGSIRFKATTGTIRVWCTGSISNDLALVVDGDVSSPSLATPEGDWTWTSFTGLDSGSEHEYIIVVGRTTSCYSVMLPGGTLNTTALTAYPADFWHGDSIIQGSNITNGDSALNFPQLFGIQMQRGWQVTGTPGGTAFSQGQTQKAYFGATSPQCERYFIEWGVNDQAGGSGVSTTNFRTAIDAILDQATADEATKQIYWIGIPKYGAASNRVSYNAETIAEIASRANPLVAYIDPDSWNGGSTISTSDGTHPDAAGAVQIADGLIAATSAPPFTAKPVSYYQMMMAG